MPRVHFALVVAALVLLRPVHSYAQVKDGFVQALIEFANAANGDVTDNGAALTAAIDAMAQGLAAWDAALARMESGLASEIGSRSTACRRTHANRARRSLFGARSTGRCAEAVRCGRHARPSIRRCACPARSGSRVGESSRGCCDGVSHCLAATTGQPDERVSCASIGGNRKWCIGG